MRDRQWCEKNVFFRKEDLRRDTGTSPTDTDRLEVPTALGLSEFVMESQLPARTLVARHSSIVLRPSPTDAGTFSDSDVSMAVVAPRASGRAVSVFKIHGGACCWMHQWRGSF